MDVVWRSRGEMNFGNSLAANFKPFLASSPVQPFDLSYVDQPFASFYGDRLGYAGSGLGDVDGDGFNDWSTTWYDATPYDKAVGMPRAPGDAYLMPVPVALAGSSSFAHTAADLQGRTTWDRVGFARVFSGRDGSQIGQELWSHKNRAIAPHEISTLEDIDGDGRDELVLSANTYNGTRGGLYVMSYSSLYNSDPQDATERWVCIMLISGQNSSSEFAYECEDLQSDFNNDGQNDIVAASTFWRMDGPRDEEINGVDVNYRTGAGWIFLTPPRHVFTKIQASTTWPVDPLRAVKRPIEIIAEEDYNLCVMQFADDGAGNLVPIDVKNDSPPGASDLRVGIIGDIADAGDLDADGHTDFAVFGGYRYADPVHGDPSTGQVTTGAVYFMLSGDGFGADAYTLHDKQSRIIDIEDKGNGDEVVLDPLFDGAPIDVYQDAEVVFYGDHQRKYSNNQRSYFARNFDGTGSTDMALVTYVGTSQAETDILLDGQAHPRFSPSGEIGMLVPSAQSGNRPLAIPYTNVPRDHQITKNSVYTSDGVSTVSIVNITGVNIAGDYDGDGDDEITIATVKPYGLGTGNPNFSQIGSVYVLDVPDTSGTPTLVRAIQHETPVYHAADDDLTGTAYGGGGMLYRGVNGRSASDLDYDGCDDLLYLCSSTPQKVLHAPDPFGSGAAIQIFDETLPALSGYRPYQSSGSDGAGSVHVLLSPPAEPRSISGSTMYSIDINGNISAFIRMTVDGISPEITPLGTGVSDDGFTFRRLADHREFVIELVRVVTDPTSGEQSLGAVCHTVTTNGVPVDVAGASAARRFSFSIPLNGCPTTSPGAVLRFRSRWINDDTSSPWYGEPWITSIPPLRYIGSL